MQSYRRMQSYIETLPLYPLVNVHAALLTKLKLTAAFKHLRHICSWMGALGTRDDFVVVLFVHFIIQTIDTINFLYMFSFMFCFCALLVVSVWQVQIREVSQEAPDLGILGVSIIRDQLWIQSQV